MRGFYALLLSVACTPGPVPDGGVGGGADSGADAGRDGGDDGGHDGGSDYDGGYDAGFCPAECNNGCVGGACSVVCGADGGCACAAGMPCSVFVFGGSRRDVDCGPATDCEILCDGAFACSTVLCSRGACRLGCAFGCSTVDCGRASSCDLHCSQDGCNGPVGCSGARCDLSCGPLANACTFTLAPIVCDAGACNISCNGVNACGGRPIVCSAGTCDVFLPPNCVNTTVDCRASSACRVRGASSSCTVACPSRCDAGCGPADDGGFRCGP